MSKIYLQDTMKKCPFKKFTFCTEECQWHMGNSRAHSCCAVPAAADALAYMMEDLAYIVEAMKEAKQ